MKALILAGGYTRKFSSISKDEPKPLLTIRGKPIIEHIITRIEHLKDVIDEIIIITNHRYIKQFQQWLENYPSSSAIKLIDNGSVNQQDGHSGIGDIAFAIKEKKIEGDLLVIGADNLFSFSLNKFIDFANNARPFSLIGAYNLNGKLKPGKFDVVKLDAQGKVIDFQPRCSNSDTSLVMMCLYFFPKEKLSLIYEYLNRQTSLDSNGHYIGWLSKQDTVYGYTFKEGNWLDVSDIDAYTEAVFTF